MSIDYTVAQYGYWIKERYTTGIVVGVAHRGSKNLNSSIPIEEFHKIQTLVIQKNILCKESHVQTIEIPIIGMFKNGSSYKILIHSIQDTLRNHFLREILSVIYILGTLILLGTAALASFLCVTKFLMKNDPFKENRISPPELSTPQQLMSGALIGATAAAAFSFIVTNLLKRDPFLREFTHLRKISDPNYLVFGFLMIERPSSFALGSLDTLRNNKVDSFYIDPITHNEIPEKEIRSARILYISNYALEVESALRIMLHQTFPDNFVNGYIPHPLESRYLNRSEVEKFIRDISNFYCIPNLEILVKCWDISDSDVATYALTTALEYYKERWDSMGDEEQTQKLNFLKKQFFPWLRFKKFLSLVPKEIGEKILEPNLLKIKVLP